MAVHHPRSLVRAGLVAALEAEPALSGAHVLADVAPILRACRAGQPYAAVLLLRNEDERAWRLVSELGVEPQVRTVALDGGLDLPGAARAIQHGVRALLPRDAPLAALVQALLPHLGTSSRVRATVPHLDLAERAVLRRLSLGGTSRDAAQELGISVSAVDEVKRRLFAKLDVGHQAHAVAVALRHGLLEHDLWDAARDRGSRPCPDEDASMQRDGDGHAQAS